MRIAQVDLNDCTNGNGICVSLWTSGCPHRCKGCHNPQTWQREYGYDISRKELIAQIDGGLTSHGVTRNFSVLGGEPLAAYNRDDISVILKEIRKKHPDILIYIWTGYTIEELNKSQYDFENKIFQYIDYLIDGRFIMAQRDLTLRLRGSRNQRIWHRVKGEWYDESN
jgi:anaerobic ribonucleoside-triphosphate reductase activating protein